MGFWERDFWGRDENIWWKCTSILRTAHFHTSLDLGPDLTCRVVAFCMGIAICHIRKVGQVWGSTAPLPKVAGKIHCGMTPLWTFNYHMEKSESFCDVTPGL